MNVENFRKILDLAKKINRPAMLYNEDSKIIATINESTRTIFDDDDEIFISFRSNVDYKRSQDYPISVTAMEYDSIKMIDFDVNLQEFKKLLELVGEKYEDYVEFLQESTVLGTHYPSNYNKKYVENKDGDKVEKLEPSIPTVILR